MLGKYLKTRYYDRLLDGNPRKLYVRSTDADKCLESAEALIAGLNPPTLSHGMAGQKDSSGSIRSWWSWFTGMAGDQSSSLGSLWQPKAIHTTAANTDDLLSSESSCLKQDAQQLVWKNSTKYAQLLNQFRHDLQTLRQNTGLEFEDDLEMLKNIEESLRARKAWQLTQQQQQASHLEDSPNAAPNWYTSTYADRLAHIADLTAGVQFGRTDTQRLYVGRLVHELLEIVSIKVGQSRGVWPINKRHIQKSVLPANNGREKSVPHNAFNANVIIYMTDKQHLTALLSALQIYSSQPNYGTALLIELHYDPNQQQHFLRLYLVGGAAQYDQMPEPVRMNPGACMDSPTECSYKQFERNLRKSALNKVAWRRLCLEHEISLDTDNEPRPTVSPSTVAPSNTLFETTTTKEFESSSKFDNSAAEQAFETTTTTATTTTVVTSSPTTTTGSNEPATSRIDIDTSSDRTNDQSQSQTTVTTTTTAPVTSEESITATGEPNNNEVTESQDAETIEKLDSTLIVGPTQVRPVTTTTSPAPTTTIDSVDNISSNNSSEPGTTYTPPQTNYYGSSSEPNPTGDVASSVEPIYRDQTEPTTDQQHPVYHMGDIYYSA